MSADSHGTAADFGETGVAGGETEPAHGETGVAGGETGAAGAEVAVESVSKVFATEAGPVRAVDGVSLEVPAGSGLAITGESGCGKSTLLSMIGALEAPSRGQVSIGGRVVSGLAEKRRTVLRRERIGFVFQSHNLLPFLSVMENVSMQLSLAGRGQGSDRPLELLASLGLGGASEKFPDQLSGGERQRVAVARALVHRPGLILADEPTGSLDTGNSEVVIDLLLEAQIETGATLVVITHDPGIAARLDRRVLLSDGRLVESHERTWLTGPGLATAAGVNRV